MANNKRNKGCFFFIFILGLIAVGGYLIYEKSSTNGTAQSDYGSSSVEPSDNGQNVQEVVFTPDILCSFLSMNENARAGLMYARKFEEKEDKQEKSIHYVFDPNNPLSYETDDDDWIKFFKDSTCFYLTFHDTADYKNFTKQLIGAEKVNNTRGDCLTAYKISDDCFACDLGFTRKGKGFQVVIAPEFKKKETPSSKPKKQEKKRSIFDEDPKQIDPFQTGNNPGF